MTTQMLEVEFAFSPSETQPVGRLALDRNVAVFQYDSAFASSGLSVNPFLGPIQSGLLRARNPEIFRGLHGVFADSLPDAWGQLLFERRLRRAGVAFDALTVLDRLAYVGNNGRGALTYQPILHFVDTQRPVDLDKLAEEAAQLLDGNETDLLFELEKLGGSSGGARPKVQVALDGSGHARQDGDLAPGFTSWIVKFRASADHFADIGPLEATYAEAARRAGIDMPQTRLVPAKSGPGYFATERFDRGPNGRRFHMLSIAGLLDADWLVPSIDYENLLQAVRGVTRDERAVLEMFRRMVFNVLAINRDDHTKQHAFLMDSDGRWRLSPAYDLTFATGPGNEHYLAVNGRGRGITRADLLEVASSQSIAVKRANAIIDEVATVVATLPLIAPDFGVTRSTIAEVGRATEQQLALMTRLGGRGQP